MPITMDTDAPRQLGATLPVGGVAALPKVAPGMWQGHTDCAVGPFTDRRAAVGYAHRLVDFGLFDVASGCIFRRDAGWFVEVRPLATPD